MLGHGIWSVDLALAGQFTISFLLSLIILKIVVTGCCIGFGFFGGVFAPALFLGALVGASVDIMLVSTSYGGSSFAIFATSCTSFCVLKVPGKIMPLVGASFCFPQGAKRNNPKVGSSSWHVGVA